MFMKKRQKFLHEKEYVSYFNRLIDLERQEEMKVHKKEIESLSGEKREKLGRAITNLRFYRREVNSLGKTLVYFRRDKEIKESEIKEGDVVLLSYGNPLKFNVSANVYSITKHSIVLMFESFPKKLSLTKRHTYRVDLYVNETTYSRIKEALKRVKSKTTLFPLSILLGHEKPSKPQYILDVKFINKKLNDVQKKAVVESLSSKNIYLIHGPPGTGKTTTLVEIALQLALKGRKVLVSADSNTAVDNFLEKISQYESLDINYVRVGNISRINKKLIEKSLDYLVGEMFYDNQTKNLYKELEKKEVELGKYVKPTPSLRRGLSDDEIIKAAISKRGIRGIPNKKIKSMAKYIKLKREINLIKEMIAKKRERIVKEILDNAQIVFTTNSTAGSDYLRDINFDVVIIDESTQATEPSSLIPLIKAPKAILAGDHKQLPPTVLSMRAREEGLEKSLFERFMELYPESSIMLKIQYRMNEKIMNFSNKMFYYGNLVAYEANKNHLLENYKGMISNIPITFVNISSKEQRRKGSTSISNKEEANVVIMIVNDLLRFYPPSSIGIISPYQDQVELLKKKLKMYDGLEIKTVDGFQGREKDIIVISLVRGNDSNNIGFLEDYRRLNVAITRAKKKLIIVGNEDTLRSNRMYRDLISYIKSEGEYVNANVLKIS